MRPTRQQIELAAYQRWERREGHHGSDHDDWSAAEKDLVFGLNYRYLARHRLDAPLVLGSTDRRRCRFCERPSQNVEAPALPAWLGAGSVRTVDDCHDCRASCEADLAASFEAFARPLVLGSTSLPRAGLPIAALKAIVRLAIAVLPAAELEFFTDTIEWLNNPDHAQDAPRLGDLGCHVYLTPAPIAAPFAALARRVNDEAPWPYMLFFLGSSHAVFQTHLPLSPRDEDHEDAGLRGPELSMSIGQGAEHKASRCVFVPVARPTPRRPRVLAETEAALS